MTRGVPAGSAATCILPVYRCGRNNVETILWALDLVAVIYLCFWAAKQDSSSESTTRRG